MTGETLRLTSGESVTVRASTPEALEVEVLLEPGKPPPPHYHPAQEEHFEVLEGTLRARIGDRKWLLHPGETLTVPLGAVHQMWNPGGDRTRALWRTTPGGRTREWFAALDSLQREGRRMPSPIALAPYLMEYRDVFRPAVKPRPLVHAALVVLAVLGRLRGYRPSA